MKAKKSLGQHFLTSTKALSQIIEAGNITTNDIVLEIGPGHGVLTERIIPRAHKTIAIEKDHELIPLLEERFAESITAGAFQIIEGDILKWQPESVFSRGEQYKLIANIPYYITGAIIEKFLSASLQPSLMVLLMQKEVAERIVSRDGKESVLSIAVKAYGKPTLIGKVPPGAFNPPPTVDSAILLISDISRDYFEGIDETLFFQVLKAVFGKKRKQIGGSLADFLGDRTLALSILEEVQIDSRTRPEDLSLSHWKTLTSAVQKSQKSVQ